MYGERFGPCRVCSINKAYPLCEGEVLVGLDIESFNDPVEQRHFEHIFPQITAPLLEADKACIHAPLRFSFRGTDAERMAFGRLLRRHATELKSAWLGTMADVFLEEGAFHPSRVEELSEEEIEGLLNGTVIESN